MKVFGGGRNNKKRRLICIDVIRTSAVAIQLRREIYQSFQPASSLFSQETYHFWYRHVMHLVPFSWLSVPPFVILVFSLVHFIVNFIWFYLAWGCSSHGKHIPFAINWGLELIRFFCLCQKTCFSHLSLYVLRACNAVSAQSPRIFVTWRYFQNGGRSNEWNVGRKH